jgi:hypothetical protein
MWMKNYAVTIHFSGSKTYFVSAPDESEAEWCGTAHFNNDIGDLGEYTEVTEVFAEPDND